MQVEAAQAASQDRRRWLATEDMDWQADDAVVGWLAGLRLPGLTGLMQAIVASTGSAGEGRWRQLGKWVAAGLVAVFALARVHLGVDAPTDVLVGAVIGVAVSVAAYRLVVPGEVFPVAYRRGSSAHLDVGGRRGEAIRRALADQLGLRVVEVEPFGLSGSAGSTPLRIKVQEGAGNERYVFGKLYAKSHLRADRSYKLGRALLYGRLEDEKPFNTVRRLVQQEVLRPITGRVPTLFREPFGETSDQVRADLASLRPLEVLWTVDSRDWAGATTEPSP